MFFLDTTILLRYNRVMDKLDINFGYRVEELMKEREIKPSEFYAALGLIPQNFYDWKNKNTVPAAPTALKVAKYFGVSVEYLLTGNRDNPLQEKVEELQDRIRKISKYAQELASKP